MQTQFDPYPVIPALLTTEIETPCIFTFTKFLRHKQVEKTPFIDSINDRLLFECAVHLAQIRRSWRPWQLIDVENLDLRTYQMHQQPCSNDLLAFSASFRWQSATITTVCHPSQSETVHQCFKGRLYPNSPRPKVAHMIEALLSQRQRSKYRRFPFQLTQFSKIVGTRIGTERSWSSIAF